jgi:hypothetical protein
MLPAPRMNDVLHRVTLAAVWESPRSQVLGRLVLFPVTVDYIKPKGSVRVTCIKTDTIVSGH